MYLKYIKFFFKIYLKFILIIGYNYICVIIFVLYINDNGFLLMGGVIGINN